MTILVDLVIITSRMGSGSLAASTTMMSVCDVPQLRVLLSGVSWSNIKLDVFSLSDLKFWKIFPFSSQHPVQHNPLYLVNRVGCR